VKNHSFAECARSLPGITIGSRVKPDAPTFPLLEQPGFSLALIHRSAWKVNSANFAQTAFSKVRWAAPGEYDVLVTWATRGEGPSCRQKRTRL
jgi:hypothetical protein